MSPKPQERPAFQVSLRAADWVIDHRWLAIAGLVIATAIFGYFAAQLTFDLGITKFYPDDSPYHAAYQSAEELFGRDDARNLIAFEVDPYTVEGIKHIRSISDAIASIDGIEKVTSLTNVQHLRGEQDSIIIEPLVAEDAGHEDLAEVRRVVRADPLLRGLYVSTDERAAAIVVDYGVPRTEAHRRVRVGQKISDVLARLGLPGVRYHQAGIPHTRNLYGRLLLKDNRSVIPGIVLLLVLVLAVVYRRPAGVILPLSAVLMALTWTYGLTVLLDRPLNMITNTLSPVVLVVGIADSIHILNAYRELSAIHRNRRAALRETIAEMAVACFLTTFTTAVGFAVLMLTNVPILREFGFICAFGVLASYVTTVLGLPVALSFLRPFEGSTTDGLGGIATRSLAAIGRSVARHRRSVLVGGMVVCALTAALAVRVERDSKVLEDLRPEHPEMVSRAFIEERFGGAMPMAVLVRGEPDDFRTPEAVQSLAKVADAMADEQILGWPVGLHSVVETLHRALLPDHPQRLPTSRPLLAQELLLYEMSGDERLTDLVTEDFSAARVIARAQDGYTDSVEETRDRIETAARAAFPDSMQVDVASTMVLAQLVNRTLIHSMSLSFLTAFVVIFITMLLMFRSWWLALLALVPNMAPLFCLVGFMSVAGIGLKVSTAFIFAIAFGIAVDDTIHFLARIKRERAQGATREAAVSTAITGTGRAMAQTTMVLVVGFSILLVSDFLATAHFGLLTSVTLTAALVADLTLLPALLLSTRRW